MKYSLASFDALALTADVAESSNGLTPGEIQTLSYLSCLMSVYDGRSADWWRYPFSVTETGAPFAHELVDAIEQLTGAGWLVRDGRVLRISAAGRAEFEFQAGLPTNSPRLRYLRAAGSAALSMPLPVLSDALANEPGLRRALAFMRRKQLLDETSLALVSEQFSILSQAVGRPDEDQFELTVPTVVWLTYLADASLEESA